MYVVNCIGASVFCSWNPSNLEHSAHSSRGPEDPFEHTSEECITGEQLLSVLYVLHTNTMSKYACHGYALEGCNGVNPNG